MTQNGISAQIDAYLHSLHIILADIPFWVISQQNVYGFCFNMGHFKAFRTWPRDRVTAVKDRSLTGLRNLTGQADRANPALDISWFSLSDSSGRSSAWTWRRTCMAGAEGSASSSSKRLPHGRVLSSLVTRQWFRERRCLFTRHAPGQPRYKADIKWRDKRGWEDHIF